MTNETLLAWHFLRDDGIMRDGRPAPDDGVWLEHKGPVVPCESGLHASVNLLDALQYAPGSLLCRVELGGDIVEHDDKAAASRRKILWRADAGGTLREFARRCAADVLHLWAAPDVVREYLATGNESLRGAARASAWASAWAAWAAGAAAGSAAGDAARDAARAAGSAAGDAARDAAWAAGSAGDAARASAGDAARDAAGDAARDAAGDAARDAARDARNARLTAMALALAPEGK